MGNIASGEIASQTFKHMVEDKFFLQETRDYYGIRMYGRYRDDLITILAKEKHEQYI